MPGFEVIDEREADQIAEIFDNGGVLFRQGFDALRNGVFKVREFEEAFADYMGVPSALAVTSGTAALRVALAVLKVQPQEEIIIPSFTFVATAEAVIEAGGVPVCVDIDETLNMDPDALLNAIGPRTRAVIAVHMLGTPARLMEIQKICSRAGLPLIEDTAWGCGGSLNNRKMGTWGEMGAFSFDFAKTMTTGEGGMLVSQDEDVGLAARAWHDHGHENNPLVQRWEDTRSSSGFNFRMTELQGAVGLAQLTKLDDVIDGQRASHEMLRRAVQSADGVVVRSSPEGSMPTYDAFVFQVPSSEYARKCRDELVKEGIGTKILPEALTWHFAAYWSHMPALVAKHGEGLRHAFAGSERHLSRSVALPTSAIGKGPRPEKVREIIDKVIDSQ